MPKPLYQPPEPGLIKVSGPDAKKFLQGQVTCNLDEVTTSTSRLGAHCNPQGRVLFLFRLFYFSEAYYLLLPHSMVSLACGLLKKYAVFFKLQMEDTSDLIPEEMQQAWAAFSPLKGIPQVYPETSGLFLPHDLNLHELQGISWDKGCYTGQEIIARMHYRGKLKNHLYQATLKTTTPPRRGAELFSPAGQACGIIIDFCERSEQFYHLLVLAQETNRSNALKLDISQNEQWEWLN